MGRDSEPREPSGDAHPFIAIEPPGPLSGIVTLTAVEDGHGSTLVEAAWTRNGRRHRHSVEAATFEDAHRLANEIADKLAAGREPDQARAREDQPDLKPADNDGKLVSALEPVAFVFAVLLAGVALAIAWRLLRRMRHRRQATREWNQAHRQPPRSPAN